MATAKKKKRKLKLASAKRAAETRGSGFERNTYRIPEGMSIFKLTAPGIKKIEILPYLTTEKTSYVDAGMHYYAKHFFVHRLPETGEAYVCPKRQSGLRCPICIYRNQLIKELGADDDMVKALKPKERQLFYVLDHDNLEAGVQLWDMSWWLFGRQLEQRLKFSEDDDGFEHFFDPYEGFTLRLGVAEKTFAGRAFYEVETVDFKERSEPIAEELWEKLDSLDELIKVTSFEKLEQIFNDSMGVPSDNEEEPEEAEELEEAIEEATDSQDEVLEDTKSTDSDDEELWEEDDEDWDD